MRNESGVVPTGDKLVVKPYKVRNMTPGGLALPDEVVVKESKAARIGRVIAISASIGENPNTEPFLRGIKEGDDVLFPRYSGDEWPVKGETYIIMRAINVIGKAECQPDYMLNAAISSLEAFGANETAIAA